MPVSYAPYSTIVHPYSSWGWSDSSTHTPSYFRPYHVEYAAPRRPSHARQPYFESDHFEYKNRSSAQNKKKVVKQVYQVKRDGHKNKSSDLNLVNGKLINVSITSVTNGKVKENSTIDLLSAKSEQKKLKRSKNKKRAPLSKTRTKSSPTLGLSNWQKKEFKSLVLKS
jgi:aconitase A